MIRIILESLEIPMFLAMSKRVQGFIVTLISEQPIR